MPSRGDQHHDNSDGAVTMPAIARLMWADHSGRNTTMIAPINAPAMLVMRQDRARHELERLEELERESDSQMRSPSRTGRQQTRKTRADDEGRDLGARDIHAERLQADQRTVTHALEPPPCLATYELQHDQAGDPGPREADEINVGVLRQRKPQRGGSSSIAMPECLLSTCRVAG